MFTFYLLVALGIFLVFLEPWNNDPDIRVDLSDIIFGVGLGLLWPLLLTLAITSYAFLALAIRKN